MTKIKICGITRFEDAQTCVENGVDFIGINFYPDSPRYVSREQARSIIEPFSKYSSNIKFVGVFVNSSHKEILETAAYCGLDFIQLHGDEDPQLLTHLRNAGLPTFKAIRGTDHLDSIGEYLASPEIADSPQLLLDAFQTNMYGGTGKTLNQLELQHIKKYLSALVGNQSIKLLLAGGLNPENVDAMINAFDPWGVDCASGVELHPGIKDPQKVSLFCSRVRSKHQTEE